MTNSFKVTNGLSQVCSMDPTLFNINAMVSTWCGGLGEAGVTVL